MPRNVPKDPHILAALQRLGRSVSKAAGDTTTGKNYSNKYRAKAKPVARTPESRKDPEFSRTRGGVGDVNAGSTVPRTPESRKDPEFSRTRGGVGDTGSSTTPSRSSAPSRASTPSRPAPAKPKPPAPSPTKKAEAQSYKDKADTKGLSIGRYRTLAEHKAAVEAEKLRKKNKGQSAANQAGWQGNQNY